MEIGEFVPYNFYQGGTVVGIAGEGYALLAGSTRLSNGFKIQSRNTDRLFPMSARCQLGAVGCWADVLGFTGLLRARTQIYELEQWAPIKPQSAAMLVANSLYNKRFFPYYVYSVMGAVDDKGVGSVYCFNPFGLEPEAAYYAVGSAAEIIEPFLDSQLGDGAMDGDDEPTYRTSRSLAKAKELVRDVFVVAAERDIFTGDGLLIAVIDKQGTKKEFFPLRRD